MFRYKPTTPRWSVDLANAALTPARVGEVMARSLLLCQEAEEEASAFRSVEYDYQALERFENEHDIAPLLDDAMRLGRGDAFKVESWMRRKLLFDLVAMRGAAMGRTDCPAKLNRWLSDQERLIEQIGYLSMHYGRDRFEAALDLYEEVGMAGARDWLRRHPERTREIPDLAIRTIDDLRGEVLAKGGLEIWDELRRREDWDADPEGEAEALGDRAEAGYSSVGPLDEYSVTDLLRRQARGLLWIDRLEEAGLFNELMQRSEEWEWGDLRPPRAVQNSLRLGSLAECLSSIPEHPVAARGLPRLAYLTVLSGVRGEVWWTEGYTRAIRWVERRGLTERPPQPVETDLPA